MQRLIRLGILLAVMSVLTFSTATAQLPQVQVSGRLAPGDVRIFTKDSTYLINKEYVVGGTLIIEPGTQIFFHPEGRLIDSVGGRIIADGFAEATYNARPHGFNPLGLAGSSSNPLSWTGYADLDYLTFDGTNPLNSTDPLEPTIDVSTERDLTVHPDKYHYIFNVVLNTANRTITDLDPTNVSAVMSDPDLEIVPFETALMFIASRMNIDPNNDVNLNVTPWSRIGGKSVDVEQEQIRFIGQPINNVSKEWGHIIILPGARAAFFRNVSFENFKKDTTVDRFPIFDETASGADWEAVNDRITQLTNGSGGAITTFSSRTWLLNAEFKNNRARYRGGALQLLEAPMGLPASIAKNQILNAAGAYPSDKNPNINDKDGSTSIVVEENPVPAIDMIDSPGQAEPFSDYERMAHDDARLAVYLGRMRNLTFENNMAQLAKYGEITIGTPPVRIIGDITDEPAPYPQKYGDHAYGGAIYISGENGSERRKMEIGFGVNHSIMVDGTEVEFEDGDTFVAIGNEANNFQSSGSSFGSRGGAIYSGRYTSLQVAGHFEANTTNANFLTDPTTGANAALYSMGGAIFVENSLNRLTVKGGPERESLNNPTRFSDNKSGAGGAIYVDGNSDPKMSTIVGGSDMTLETRDAGFDIVFENNEAISYGGAIYSKRHGSINGSGGVNAGDLVGYGGKYPVRFMNNKAGYAGGAVVYDIPDAEQLPYHQRTVQVIRAMFSENSVGMDIEDANIGQVRGGGAIYSIDADMNLVKGTEFSANMVYNGNGGAVALVEPSNLNKRFFVSDIDEVMVDGNGVVNDYMSGDGAFTYDPSVQYPADSRMLTRFKNNTVEVEDRAMDEMGSGATQFRDGVFRTRSQLLATDWTSTQTGYAVGLFGTIVKFTNGGENWTYPTSGTNYRLTDVEFVNSSKGFAAGAQGTMLMTTDAGNNWNVVNTGTNNQFNDIYAIGQNYIYAVTNGGLLYYSANGGTSWTTMMPQPTDLNGVYFSSQNTGYVVGDNSLILRTSNGGQDWEEVVPPIPSYDLRKIHFQSVNMGYIIGDAGTVLMTDDGGDSWFTVDPGTSANLTDIEFISQNTGFITTVYGDISMTNDGGQTWTLMEDLSRFGLHGILFASNSTGYAVGDYGTLLKTEDGGTTWSEINPVDAGYFDAERYHPGTQLPENGIGLGGALYIVDNADVNNVNRTDTINFNRVRIIGNTAYTGSAIYSDNFDLKLVLNKSLVSANTSTSEVGLLQNAIYGPVRFNGSDISENEASSDLASAVIYGEVQGPLPSASAPEAGNSIYDNNARFVVRLPDAPNTKSVLSGTTGIGFGGTDTLRGNYWGTTEANVSLEVPNDFGLPGAINETFFVAGDGTSPLPFVNGSTDPLEQGPFESIERFTYTPILIDNEDGDENTPADGSINEQLLMSGAVYDLYDKGTDIKTADYSKRIMSPIEDFAVGIPHTLRRYDDDSQPSYEKYIKRYTRDPYCVGKVDDNGDLMFPYYTQLQDEFSADPEGNFYHPIGYPLYLESNVNYEGLAERSNHIPEVQNESVFFIINETTGDFIRANFDQVSEEAPFRETFRARVELVPDSSNRNANSLFRRTQEGLFNFGVGFSLLAALEDNPYNEESATLLGRKYLNNYQQFGKVPDIFSNRPSLTDNVPDGEVAYFAGERYRALPVDTGDVVRIVSRTVLWKEGVVPAYDDGISFKIVHSTLPPEFTGDVITTQEDTVTKLVPSLDPVKRANGIYDTLKIDDFTNRIFISEDRSYPQPDGTYDNPNVAKEYRGRDSIFTITAVDSNNFYDPRALADGDNYTYLTYSWRVDPGAGLEHWLMVDTLNVNDPNSTKDGAIGHMMFRGTATNPYVVPGGERVRVAAANYPPMFRTIDSLRGTGLFTDEQIDKYIETFGPYFNAESYDEERARFLQQDTLNFGADYEVDYEFQLYVTDSIPVFLGPEFAEEALVRYETDGVTVRDTLAVYSPSVYTCETTEDGRLRANLTDKLRFQIDINTDDEAEDYWADENTDWDFRYGRTAYGFENLIISGSDTVVVDSVVISNEDGGLDTLIDQERPIWMADEYLYEYDGEDTQDEFTADFTTFGQLNVRIDSLEAVGLLTPANQFNEALNTDTTFSVIVNDGHGGKLKQRFDVFINVAPQFDEEAFPGGQLPAAKEAIDYQDMNGTPLIDSTRMIKIKDANFGQSHTFELIYEGRGDIPKDPCYEEAGAWVEGVDYGVDGFTPDWLKINEESGLLYGTPGITDAPKDEKVIVLVTDEDGLPALREFDLRVDSTNWNPFLTAAPDVACIDPNEEFADSIIVGDRDLLRDDALATETLTLTIVSPSQGLEISPSTISSDQVNNDSIKVAINATPDIANVARDADGRITVVIEVTDEAGNTATQTFRFRLSDPTYFAAPITVTNDIGSFDILHFGTADNATTGDGRDNNPQGSLDPEYCEYELPPFPQQDVFDARWTIPTINGTDRNIFPEASNGDQIYIANFQAGGESGQTQLNYPVTIEWNSQDVPAVDDAARNPSGSTWYIRDAVSDGEIFNINMNRPDIRFITPQVEFEQNGDDNTLTIISSAINAFVIYRDVASDVETDNIAIGTSIRSITPNPVSSDAQITYTVREASNVRLEVVDQLGKVVRVLEDANMAPGDYPAEFDGRDMNGDKLPSGSYSLRLATETTTDVKTLIIVK